MEVRTRPGLGGGCWEDESREHGGWEVGRREEGIGETGVPRWWFGGKGIEHTRSWESVIWEGQGLGRTGWEGRVREDGGVGEQGSRESGGWRERRLKRAEVGRRELGGGGSEEWG
jgi:hypothetical protein